MNTKKLSGFERLEAETDEKHNTIDTYRLMNRTKEKLETEIARKKAHRNWSKKK